MVLNQELACLKFLRIHDVQQLPPCSIGGLQVLSVELLRRHSKSQPTDFVATGGRICAFGHGTGYRQEAAYTPSTLFASGNDSCQSHVDSQVGSGRQKCEASSTMKKIDDLCK